MAKNISKQMGMPTSKECGIDQHNQLVKKLKNNDYFVLPSMNRGYLVLKHEVAPMYRKKPLGRKVDIYPNYLQKSKPTGKYIKVTKV